jgi:hypothetical protein
VRRRHDHHTRFGRMHHREWIAVDHPRERNDLDPFGAGLVLLTGLHEDTESAVLLAGLLILADRHSKATTDRGDAERIELLGVLGEVSLCQPDLILRRRFAVVHSTRTLVVLFPRLVVHGPHFPFFAPSASRPSSVKCRS